MELRYCQYFLAVTEAGNITRAAAQLGISQPSLSQQMRRFKELLGSQLFIRSGRSIRLTAAGEILMPHARQLVQVAELAKREVAAGQTLESGKLSVAFIPSLERLVTACVVEFMRLYPGIKVELRQQMGRAIYRLLLDGEIELGLAVKRVAPPEITAEELYREPYVLALRDGHPLQDVNCSRLSSIGKTPFAVFSYGTFSRDAADEYLSKIKFSPNICLESESLENLLHMVSNSDMCAMLPKHATQRCVGIRHQELLSPRPTRIVSALALGNATRSPAMREFIKLFKSVVAEEALREQ